MYILRFANWRPQTDAILGKHLFSRISRPIREVFLQYHVFAVGPLEANCAVLFESPSGDAVVIDPGGDANTITRFLDEHHLTPRYFLHTHGHFDHVGALSALKKKYPDATYLIHQQDETLAMHADKTAQLYGLQALPATAADAYLSAETSLQLGASQITVIETPGHTPGGVCFYLNEENLLFSGDTLFQGSIGRTDLPGGNYDQLIHSIRTKLFGLPDEVVVIPGHGPRTSIGAEKKHNPFFRYM
ncbi:beta-lactamase domain protein [Desulfurispirillum indicum S5]|uniref:Beta-lactamase domain protein n=1 Tax=Desulfurispirillum indicum (strain ATCC BAA-1389 / DSM 22839 / S5) TaxID=653733 RepID=E6W1Y5_DESIS|nr:beta-lactamase domain protein [Desulfurispirillum indicum S5]